MNPGKMFHSYSVDSPLIASQSVNSIPPDTEIHEQMTMTNGYESVYDYKHTSNIGETIVDNYVNDATHVDSHKMQT